MVDKGEHFAFKSARWLFIGLCWEGGGCAIHCWRSGIFHSGDCPFCCRTATSLLGGKLSFWQLIFVNYLMRKRMHKYGCFYSLAGQFNDLIYVTHVRLQVSAVSQISTFLMIRPVMQSFLVVLLPTNVLWKHVGHMRNDYGYFHGDRKKKTPDKLLNVQISSRVHLFKLADSSLNSLRIKYGILDFLCFLWFIYTLLFNDFKTNNICGNVFIQYIVFQELKYLHV